MQMLYLCTLKHNLCYTVKSSSFCAPWSGTAIHRRPLPSSHISRQQTVTWYPPLVATSWSVPPPRTSAPVHSLWRAQHLRQLAASRRHYRHLYPIQWLLQIVWTRHALVMTLFMLRHFWNRRRYYYYYYFAVVPSILVRG